MGRKSKLTENQWQTIGKRLLAGEGARALGREYGVSDSAIRQRFSSHHEKIKDVANQILTTEASLKALPMALQIDAHNLAAQLRSISNHLASAANFGAATAHRLSGIAHNKVQEIDDAAPLNDDSLNALKGIAVLTRMANESSEIGLGLLKANKETVDNLNKDSDRPPEPKQIVFTVTDARA